MTRGGGSSSTFFFGSSRLCLRLDASSPASSTLGALLLGGALWFGNTLLGLDGLGFLAACGATWRPEATVGSWRLTAPAWNRSLEARPRWVAAAAAARLPEVTSGLVIRRGGGSSSSSSLLLLSSSSSSSSSSPSKLPSEASSSRSEAAHESASASSQLSSASAEGLTEGGGVGRRRRTRGSSRAPVLCLRAAGANLATA